MIKKLFDDFLFKCMSLKDAEIVTDPTYVQLVEKQSDIFKDILKVLPEDKKHLMTDYDSRAGLINSILEENRYKSGISDGMKILKEFKLFQFKPSKDNYIRFIYEIEEKYRTEELNVPADCDTPLFVLIEQLRPGNLSDYITFVCKTAYESGKKDGFEEVFI